MFKAGDKVVCFSTDPKLMGVDRTVTAAMKNDLGKVQEVSEVHEGEEYAVVRTADGSDTWCYGLSSLRYATPEEIREAERKEEPEPVPSEEAAAVSGAVRPGAVVETTGYGIGFVFSDKDSDGDYQVGTPSDGDYHFISEDGIKRVLYYVGADGGISFGQSQSLEKPSKASELRIGDVIKITSLDSTCSAIRIGQYATIENKDESDLPLFVRYVDGGCDWLRDEGWEFVSRP